MPRGAKIDVQETAAALANGLLVHPKSFISTKGHIYLTSKEEIGPVRAKVMERDKWTCQVCGARVSDDYFETHPLKAELHHVNNKTWNRCDCLHNLQAICHKCHGKKHKRW